MCEVGENTNNQRGVNQCNGINILVDYRIYNFNKYVRNKYITLYIYAMYLIVNCPAASGSIGMLKWI